MLSPNIRALDFRREFLYNKSLYATLLFRTLRRKVNPTHV